ncbi:MAG: MFS transporter, partial [Paracoccaceae bacterium]
MPPSSPSQSISRMEFIVLAAMMFAGIALSTDAMLPAYPEMAADLTPDAVNSVQLVLSIFVLGMGVGTLFTGPLSDSFGRKPVILAGAALYILASAICVYAQSLEVLLVARFVQGLGAAGPRVVTLAVIRDLYSGPQMARLVSFVMIVFTLVPALAPTIGAMIVALSDWRGIFILFVVYAVIYTLWMTLRLPETLPPEARRPFRAKPIMAALHEV